MSIRNMMIGGAGATAPDAPTGVSASNPTSTTLDVSFSAPANNGGSAITSFTVTSSPGGLTATGASSPLTVTGLTASTSYTFTVTATNAIGTSVASSPSSAVSTQAPALYVFTTATFTPGGRRGRAGPTVAQMRSGVGSPSWASSYLNTGDVAGVQAWTVPQTGNYDITVAGATGGVGGSGGTGTYRAGRGAIFKGTFSLNSSEVLYMVAGHRGGSLSEATGGGGGGGASFVALSNRNSGSLLIIAGAGGGGSGNTNAGNGGDGQSASSDGGVGTNGSSLAGSSGAGGGSGTTSNPGGAGWLSNGGSHADSARTTGERYASALSNAGDCRGGAGGACEASVNPSAGNNWDLNGNADNSGSTNGSGQGTDQGGFGGGGAGEWCSAGQCGGGGGYSGGGGSASSNGTGGGGGSLVTNATGRLVTNSGFQGYNPSSLSTNPGQGSTVGSAKTNYGNDGYIIITKV